MEFVYYNSFKNINIFNHARIGFEFEFFSDFDIKEVAKSLQSNLGKKILIFDKHGSEFKPNSYTFKLEKDYSGGEYLIELVTGPLEYIESRIILIKVLEWIKLNGSTNDRSSIHINISFDDNFGKNFMYKFDPLKFILDFDENEVYKRFPTRRNSVYCKTIKFIVPNGKFYLEDFGEINPKNFIVPGEKYYGINFSKLSDQYLEFRYIGGEGYEKKYQKILELMNYFIISIYNTLSSQSYSDDNKKELQKIIKRYKKVLDAYNSYDDFVKYFPDIELSIDLNKDPLIVKTYYGKLQNKLFSILTESNMKIGKINLDTDLSRIQLKDVDIKIWNLKDVEIFNSIISNSYLNNCDIYGSKIINSDGEYLNAYNNTLIENSKIKNSFISSTSGLKNCYLHGKLSTMNGIMDDGIFREGKIGKYAKISDSTEIVECEKI